MTTTSRNARIAGLLYLSLLIPGPLRLIYIPSKLIVSGNATATAGNIAAHEMLFRLGMMGDVVGAVLLIFVALALYRLFREVDPFQAVLVVILGGIMPAALYLFNVANDAATLMLVRGADFLSVFDKPQRDALAMMFLRLHDQEVYVAEIFWGLWLFPLGILVYRSRFMPRFLGVWLIFGGFAYLAMSFAGLVVPRYYDLAYRIGAPGRLAEIATMLWLLIMGAKEKPAIAPVARAA